MSLKFAVVGFVLIMGQFSFANPADIDTIVNLASQIRIAAKNTTASDADLKSIIKDLQSHLNILNASSGGGTGSGGFDPECYKFAYEKYYQTYSSSESATRATAACKKVADAQVLKFLYEKFYTTFTASKSMDEAAARSGREIKRKLDMLQFAWEKYYTIYTSMNAAIKAHEQVSLVRAGSIGCFQSVYPGFYSSLTASKAMDATINACK